MVSQMFEPQRPLDIEFNLNDAVVICDGEHEQTTGVIVRVLGNDRYVVVLDLAKDKGVEVGGDELALNTAQGEEEVLR